MYTLLLTCISLLPYKGLKRGGGAFNTVQVLQKAGFKSHSVTSSYELSLAALRKASVARNLCQITHYVVKNRTENLSD